MKFIAVLLISLFVSCAVCDLTNARFVVSRYSSSDNTCEGNKEWTGEVEYNGECAYVKDGVYLKVTAGDNDGFVVGVYADSACFVRTVSVDMKEFELDTCKAITLIVTWGHIRVSRAFFCFPGDSQVALESGDVINMEDLKVGDVVRTKHGYSEVYAFLDKRPNEVSKFQKIYYNNEAEELQHIRLTGEHLILAKKTKESEEKFILAENVQVGDYIHTMNEDGEYSEVQVLKVESVEAKGTFTPATMDGTIVVDNVVASIGAVVSHEVCHAVLYPLRLAYSINPSWVPDQAEGIHPYAQKFRDTFSSWLNADESFYSAPKLE
eukprot:TRINITY_DN12106_c0_g1_i1.p1 TRINITY_DN12106_c0_g1~~TRINITY_DN12106_c0_g1_i1.p1  ORF type:complete len:322 (-),score=91.75 TRINITY_DN12106_c0_g1_i1:40-1005(-)